MKLHLVSPAIPTMAKLLQLGPQKRGNGQINGLKTLKNLAIK
jgi:hypothetical protein